MKKLIVLNGGTQTQQAFMEGCNKLDLSFAHSKEMILHIRKDLSCTFLYKNKPLDFTDTYVFTRLRATDAHFCGILYEHFAALGIPASYPINTSFKSSEEKIAQMPRLARAGIKIPETIIAREESYKANKDYILKQITFPLVFKTDGSQGRNVYKVETIDELEEKIAQKKPHELFLLQNLIPNTFDTRTLVAYRNILGSIKRSAQAGQFLNNVAQGGDVAAYELTAEEQAISIHATDVCGLDFGGVDIIHTETGPYILEVNKSPQIKGFEKIYGIHFVFSSIARMIEKQMFSTE